MSVRRLEWKIFYCEEEAKTGERSPGELNAVEDSRSAERCLG